MSDGSVPDTYYLHCEPPNNVPPVYSPLVALYAAYGGEREGNTQVPPSMDIECIGILSSLNVL